MAKPVTAVAWLPGSRHLLVGSESDVELYDARAGHLLASLTAVLPAGRVHGLRVQSGTEPGLYRVVVRGQKRVAILGVCEWPGLSVLRLATLPVLSDWVLDALLAPEIRGGATGGQVAIGFAHNVVEMWSWVGTGQLLWRVQCVDSSLLCSLRLDYLPGDGEAKSTLVCAAGTVFSPILLWLPTQSAAIVATLRGHAGPVFRLAWWIVEATSQLRLLSASDDRSLRLWQSELAPASHEAQTILTTLRAGPVLYGHGARVWDAVWAGPGLIASCGEDSSCRLWNAVGQPLGVLTGHSGKNVWGVAVSDDLRLLATGGADCQVRISALEKVLTPAPAQNFPLPPALPGSRRQDEFVRALVVVGAGSVVVGTNSGGLYRCDYAAGGVQTRLLRHDPAQTWSELVVCSARANTLFVTDHAGMHSLICTSTGDLLGRWQGHQQRAVNLFALRNAAGDVASYGAEGRLRWWCIDGTSLDARDPSASLPAAALHGDFSVPWTADAMRSITAVCVHGQQLVCGDSKGSLYLYEIGTAAPLVCIPNAHHRERVSTIAYAGSDVFLSGGRDGHILTVRLFQALPDECLEDVGGEDTDEKTHSLLVLRSQSVNAHISSISEILVYAREQVHVCGFYGTVFVARNLRTDVELLRQEVGSSRRPFSYSLDEHNTWTLAYAAEKQVNLLTDSFVEAQVLRPAFHGREVHSLVFLEYGVHQESALCVSCSEDTTLRLQRVSANGALLGQGHVLEGHRCTVRRVRELGLPAAASQEEGCLLVSVGGKETLRVWRVRRSEDSRAQQQGELQVDCIAAHNKHSLALLRRQRAVAKAKAAAIMLKKQQQDEKVGGSKRKAVRPPESDSSSGEEPEEEDDFDSRLLDTVCFWEDGVGAGESHAATVISGCSDSSLRVHRLVYAGAGSAHMSAIGRIPAAHSGPVLAVEMVAAPSIATRLVLTGGTDGHIRVWDSGKLLLAAASNIECESELGVQVHQSGVNAVAALWVPASETVVAVTGGDDQSLSVVRICSEGQKLFVLDGRAHTQLAHASAVKSVNVIVHNGAVLVASASTDQRINVWRLEETALVMLRSLFVTVSDLAGLAVRADGLRRLMIAGAGCGLTVESVEVGEAET
eukprot:TRINITY_DN8300_c0_g1_i1.p1 TRINITY_DN8300_c0_g1~~TRINITY_DN8300_c0_g1_i1.p1  ORF type:complete len:1114 (+),score=166.32 TRINITY_DN8300_c0_g1_i1:25-3366(+)